MDRSMTTHGPGGAAPAAALLVCLGIAGLLGACGGGGGGGGRADRPLTAGDRPLRPEAGDSSAERAAPDLGVEDGRDALAPYAADLQSLFNQMKSPDAAGEPLESGIGSGSAAPAQRTAAASAAIPVSPAPSPPAPEPIGGAAAASEVHGPVAAGAPAEEAPAAAEVPQPTEEQRRAELLAQLSAILGSDAGDPGRLGSEGPLGRAVRLAALEAIEPGVARAELDRLEAELLPAEAAVLRPLRELFSRLGGSAIEQGDPAAIASLMDEYTRRLAQARPLAIPAAVLCERVESFGRYTPFRSTTFAAGREHTAILYVEVDHFVQRSAPGEGPALGGAEVWVTELGQTLDLHHDADGSLQWRQAEQVVRDASRRRRSDYYLVQRVTLPSTLSVGRYNLKVTVTDKVSGGTAQARIPIQIVADASLATTPRR